MAEEKQSLAEDTLVEVSKDLSELLSNSVNMADKFFEIFFDPNPHLVTLELYDREGTKTTYQVPNRAMDKSVALSGKGSPEGVINAEVGTLYIDEDKRELYIKRTNDSNMGWLNITPYTLDVYTDEFTYNYELTGNIKLKRLIEYPEHLQVFANGVFLIPPPEGITYDSTATEHTYDYQISDDKQTLFIYKELPANTTIFVRYLDGMGALKGDTAIKVTVGETTTLNAGEDAKVTEIVEDVDVAGAGQKITLDFAIPRGATGNTGVHIGENPPTDPNQNIWLDTNASGTTIADFATMRIWDSGICSNLSGYNKVYDIKHSYFMQDSVQKQGGVYVTSDGVMTDLTDQAYTKYVKIPYKIGNLKGKSWYISGKCKLRKPQIDETPILLLGERTRLNGAIFARPFGFFFAARTGDVQDNNELHDNSGVKAEILYEFKEDELEEFYYELSFTVDGSLFVFAMYDKDTNLIGKRYWNGPPTIIKNSQLIYMHSTELLNVNVYPEDYIVIGAHIADEDGNVNRHSAEDEYNLRNFTLSVSNEDGVLEPAYSSNLEKSLTLKYPDGTTKNIKYYDCITGAKVADVAYKPIIDDYFNITGKGNIYLLDEQNKTFELPKPDLYGLIGSLDERLDSTQIADTDLSNLTEEGLKVIKDNSGSGLEVCDTDIVIRDDKKIFEQLKQMQHSTFDLSKFEVVGSPTITEDGVASGFSAGNYIYAPVTLTSNNKIKITDNFTYTSEYISGSGKQIYVAGNKQFRIFARPTAFNVYIADGSSGLAFNARGSEFTIAINDTIYYELIIDNSAQHSLKIWKNGQLYVNKTSTLVANFDKTNFYVGTSNWGDYALYSSIDLKQFSVTVDGKEVFSGNKTGIDTVKINNIDTEIPYTQSKTGSKIVDSVYRDRVIDLYEQEGKAKYYTIDEENKNFTLPMGEIYGMIEDVKKSGGGSSGLEVCDIGMALYVDESKGLRRYLNGQIVDINTNTQAFLNRLLEIKNTNPDYFTTEANWQSEALLNIDGCVYKFVLNYSGETVVSVRLPKYPDYVEINAGGTLPVVGNGMTLGLTNGTINGGLYAGDIERVYDLVLSPSAYGLNVGVTGLMSNENRNISVGVTTDATKSGLETTLNQTKLKLRYFIQIATGAETENNIINDIELNNPYSLFDSKYSDHELNNISWLKSEGQWNAKAVYPTAYDKLLKVYNGTEIVEGLSVKLSTETYTDYDFVLNIADETFRLPLLDGSEDLPSDRYDNLELKASNSTYTAPANGWYFLRKWTTSQGKHIEFINLTSGIVVTEFDEYQFTMTNSPNQHAISIPVKRGDIIQANYTFEGATSVFRFIYAEGNGSLYYYVGETVQNANLIDAGRIGEQLANKTDMLQASGAGMPSNRYIDLTLGASGSTYTAPANGWFCSSGRATSENGYISFEFYNGLYQQIHVRNSGQHLGLVRPASKGDTLQINYENMADMYIIFTYAEGSK